MRLKHNGFTLIELLVVISIIALLASVVLVALNGARDKAKITRASADIQQINKAVIKYRVDNGDTYDSVPWQNCWVDADWNVTALGGNNICSQTQWNSGWFSSYISGVPLDPWGHPYLFEGRPEPAYGECTPGQTSLCSAGPNGILESINDAGMVVRGDDICIFSIPEC